METEAPRYFEIGNSTKGATLFGCVPRRATDNDGILSKIATPKCWFRNCWPEETGSQNSVWRGMNILWLNMFRILFAKDITPPLNRLWRCCTTIVALLGKWWSWQLWLWDDYDQPLAVRELPFFCFGTSLNPATLVKIPVLWRHNHRRRTCPSPPEKNNVWKVLSNLSLASPLGRIKIPHELYTWLKSWLLYSHSHSCRDEHQFYSQTLWAQSTPIWESWRSHPIPIGFRLHEQRTFQTSGFSVWVNNYTHPIQMIINQWILSYPNIADIARLSISNP